jgi:hypothetical protein
MYLSIILYCVIFNFITLPLEPIIFEFFDIDYSLYGIYFLWMRCLTIFFALLPEKQKNVFE